MGRALNWLFIAILIFGIYRLVQKQKSLSESHKDHSIPTLTPAQTPSLNSQAQTKTVEPKAVHANAPKLIEAPKSSPATTGSGPLPPLPKKAVPFRMINGLMVAYGDVVLGKPVAENVPDNGFAEAPQPQFWNQEIPFLVSSDIENPDAVYKAIEYFNENTTIHFVPAAENVRDAIVFEPTDDHCYSYLGRIGGHQPVYLSKNCTEPEVIHELMHVLGFVHEQSRPDREQYVQINWENIEKERQDQFYEVPESLVTKIATRPFDYNSVMLYLPTAFAKEPGLVTMESKTETPVAPVRTGLSVEDLERIRKIYPSPN